jgi:hypothetical protein
MRETTSSASTVVQYVLASPMEQRRSAAQAHRQTPMMNPAAAQGDPQRAWNRRLRWMLIGTFVSCLAGTWNLVHGRSAGAQTIVVGAAMGVALVIAIHSTLRTSRPRAAGDSVDTYAFRNRLLHGILTFFVTAIAAFLIYLALPGAQ